MGCGAAKAVGGGGGITFQQAIESGELPHDTSSFTTESVLSKYYVKLNYEKLQKSEIGTLYPVLSTAYAPQPLSIIQNYKVEKNTHFIALGIHSKYDGQKGFRPPICASIIVDVSGSMGREQTLSDPFGTTCYTIAVSCVESLLREGLTHPHDVVSIFLSGTTTSELVSFQPVSKVLQEMEVLAMKLRQIVPGGTGDLARASYVASQSMKSYSKLSSNPETTYRMFVFSTFVRIKKQPITDTTVTVVEPAALPATTTTDVEYPSPALERLTPSLADWSKGDPTNIETVANIIQVLHAQDVAQAAAARKKQEQSEAIQTLTQQINHLATSKSLRICTTLFPIGYFAPIDEVEKATRPYGANYVSVGTPAEFSSMIREHFEFLVTPLVQNVRVEMQSSPFRLVQTYGWTQVEAVDQDNCEFMRMPTIFPSPLDPEKGVKGGVIVLELTPKREETPKSPPDPSLYTRPTVFVLHYEDHTGALVTSRHSIVFPAVNQNEPLTSMYSSSGIRKALLLHTYASYVTNSVRRARYDKGKMKEFRSYFESEASIVGDTDVLEELKLWDTVLDLLIKKGKSEGCSIM
eukprot:PhF_6_TR29094/c0_g1_i1/m.42431